MAARVGWKGKSGVHRRAGQTSACPAGQPARTESKKALELPGPDRVLELADGLGLDLADALARDLEDPPTSSSV
jgi:hypothetical protein